MAPDKYGNVYDADDDNYDGGGFGDVPSNDPRERGDGNSDTVGMFQGGDWVPAEAPAPAAMRAKANMDPYAAKFLDPNFFDDMHTDAGISLRAMSGGNAPLENPNAHPEVGTAYPNSRPSPYSETFYDNGGGRSAPGPRSIGGTFIEDAD